MAGLWEGGRRRKEGDPAPFPEDPVPTTPTGPRKIDPRERTAGIGSPPSHGTPSTGHGGAGPVQTGGFAGIGGPAPTAGGFTPPAPVPYGGGGPVQGGGMPPLPPPPVRQAAGPMPALNMSAQMSPELMGLLGTAKGYISDLQNSTGELEETTASKIRDVREGGRAGLMQSEAFRGVASSGRLAGYDAQTGRDQIAGINDAAERRRGQVGNAIGLAGGLAGAANSGALSEKNLQLNAYQAQQQAAAAKVAQEAAQDAQNYRQWLSLIQFQRASPMYSSGYGG